MFLSKRNNERYHAPAKTVNIFILGYLSLPVDFAVVPWAIVTLISAYRYSRCNVLRVSKVGLPHLPAQCIGGKATLS